MVKPDPIVLGFAAYSGTGKTTLLERLIPILRSKGLRIAMIKHAHHDFDIDIPGKDSYRLRKAGADQMLIASDRRLALIEERSGDPELPDLIAKLDLSLVDIILVEGFRHRSLPKIELHRPSLGKPFIYPDDDDVFAIASDEDIDAGELPVLSLNAPESIADFIHDWWRVSQGEI